MDEQVPSPPQAPREASKSNSTLLVVLLIIIAAAIGYLIWQQKNAAPPAPSNTWATEAMQKQLIQQESALRSLQIQLSELQKKSADRDRQVNVDDIVYLVNLANLNLIAGRDVDSARQLLKMAMEKVALRNNPAFKELQGSLESDFSRLTAMASFNVESVILTLDNINKRIQQLSILPNLRFQAAPTPTVKTTDTLPWYKRFLHSFAGLKDLFIIRYVGANAIPLISPPEEAYLKENIQTKILQAQWAVIHQKPLIYQRNLKDVEMWLKKYFHNPQTVQPIIDSLTKLQSINVKPDFPGLDNSLRILSQLKMIKSEGLPKALEPGNSPDIKDSGSPKMQEPIKSPEVQEPAKTPELPKIPTPLNNPIPPNTPVVPNKSEPVTPEKTTGVAI